MMRTAVGWIAIEPVRLRDVHFATDDRFDAGLIRSLVEPNGAEEIAVIRDGNRRHFVLCGRFRQRVVIARAVEKTETRMEMQMHKAGHKSLNIPFLAEEGWLRHQ